MRSVWCLVLPVFLGCSGQNVVAGQEQTKSEELEARLPSWCRSFCVEMSACAENRPCDCAGDVCNCIETDVDDCTGNCQKELLGYTRQGDACADLGERYRQCVDALSCEQLLTSDARRCEPTASERVVCPNNDGEDPPEAQPGGSGGTVSAAGSATIEYGTAGSAYGIPGSGGATSTGGSASGGAAPTTEERYECEESYAAGGAPGGAATLVCEEGRLQCADGHSYSWLCARGNNEELGCTCFKDGKLQGGFDPQSPGCPTVERVNEACGFKLAE